MRPTARGPEPFKSGLQLSTVANTAMDNTRVSIASITIPWEYASVRMRMCACARVCVCAGVHGVCEYVCVCECLRD